MKYIFFGKNLKILRKAKGLTQDDMLATIGFKGSTWSGYEIEKSFPKFEDLLKISEFFGINEGDLINSDLSLVNLNEIENKINEGKNVNLIVNPNVNLNAKKAQKEPCKECITKEGLIAQKDKEITLNTKLIVSQEAQISLLQNKIDIMQFERREAAESQYTPKEDRKTA